MPLNLVLPAISEFMEAGIVERRFFSPGQAFRRGDVLARVGVEMTKAGDALACPPGLVIELVTAEPGILLEWIVSEGQQIAPGTTMATASPGGAPSVDAGLERALRCAVREVLE